MNLEKPVPCHYIYKTFYGSFYIANNRQYRIIQKYANSYFHIYKTFYGCFNIANNRQYRIVQNHAKS